MDSSYGKYVSRLSEISRKKYGYLQDMLSLTQKQTETIVEDGIENLQKSIDEKQRIIDAIDKFDEEFNVYFQRLKSILNVTSLADVAASKFEEAAELKDITGKILAIIKEIGDLEKQNNTKAKKLYEGFGEEIRKINAGKRMSSSYAPKKVNSPSFFIDKKK